MFGASNLGMERGGFKTTILVVLARIEKKQTED
jgi:hypothetical protein